MSALTLTLRRQLRASLQLIKSRFPQPYWRVRNGAALLLWCARSWRRRVGSEVADAYDDAFWTFHDVGDWTGFASLVLRTVAVRSIAEIGCGHGLALEALVRADPSLTLLGLEASPAALARARARDLPVEVVDIVAGGRGERTNLVRRLSAFDLVLCLEVAEHLPPWHAGKLMDLMTTTPYVIFSAAHPNQGGRLHVNEQPASYWITKFEQRGFHLSSCDEAFRRDMAILDLPPWYAANAHLFERSS
jgi:SAM-dependent methyltransferase